MKRFLYKNCPDVLTINSKLLIFEVLHESKTVIGNNYN